MRGWLAPVPLLIALLAGYPLAATATHGLDFRVWPEGVDTPAGWYLAMLKSFGGHLSDTYWDMLLGRSAAFAGGGQAQLAAVALPAFALSFLLTSGKPRGPVRASTPVYGDAKFATARDRRRMKVGLEIGTDPHSGRTIRIAVKGNLTTIAPPGSGKSSGLLLPNLVAPEASAWFGPAVVIDPKGDAYRAVGDRRRALGRAVHCLDPMGLVGGGDRWNPLENLDPNDIIYLQRTAEALLPTPGANETQYFREAANGIIVAAFLAAHREGGATPLRIAELLSQQAAFAEALAGLDAVAAKSTLALIQNPPKNIMDLFSTAQQAFRWCEDPRLAALTMESSFALASIRDGDADLFLTLPTEDIGRLSPLIRWLLNDLFATIRRRKPRERMIVFIDEAKALGRFGEILTAYGELPGYNTSLWTFWQNRPQIVEVYGENGAKDLLSNSEVVTLADVAKADPDSLDMWSRALGEFTMVEESRTVTEKTATKPGSVSTGTTLKAVRLMPPETLSSLPASDLVALVNSPRYTRDPLVIRKTCHDDRRLRGLVRDLGGRADAG
jgi:type IV secretion system protein VirD4